MHVRVVAPSGCFDRDRFDAGVQALKAAGFQVSFNDGVSAREAYLAGDDALRTGDFEDALGCRPDVIWAVRGGSGSGRIVAQVANALPEKLPILVGFSDITVWHEREQQQLSSAYV